LQGIGVDDRAAPTGQSADAQHLAQLSQQ
jgi:hypothetical protein